MIPSFLFLPLCHIAERMFSLSFPMYVGYTVNFAESVNTLQEDMKEISPTAFLQTPPHLGEDAFKHHDSNAGCGVLQAMGL